MKRLTEEEFKARMLAYADEVPSVSAETIDRQRIEAGLPSIFAPKPIPKDGFGSYEKEHSTYRVVNGKVV